MKAKIAIACSGLGYIRRGLETFTDDLFRQLELTGEFHVFLLKGAGKKKHNELSIWHLRRDFFIARLVGKIIHKHPFYIQNVTFALGLIPFLIKTRPEVVYTGEPVVYRCLQLWRSWSGQKFKMIFFTGGQSFPISLDHRDILHHVTPELVPKAALVGISVKNQFVLPHFIIIAQNADFPKGSEKVSLKQKLGLPTKKQVILSVGALDSSVKRMNYIIEEVSSLPETNHFLVLVGEREQETNTIIQCAQENLSRENYIITTLTREKLKEYYHAADVFVLASLKEGFGLVYLEALAAGLPVLTHDHSTAHFVLQEHGYYADFAQPKKLAELLLWTSMSDANTLSDSRYQFVYENYSWDVLKDGYLKMFRDSVQ